MGLLVLEVTTGGAADQATLLVGDLLTGINGKPFQSVDDFSDALESVRDGALTLQFERGDRANTREVAIRWPAQGAAA
jgi:S1-C subfamily serine protease